MFTNTFSPHVGGVARLIETLIPALQARGHQVTIVAPEVNYQFTDPPNVIRVPAVQAAAADVAVPLTLPFLTKYLLACMWGTQVDVVHSHHPFLLGDVAVTVARDRRAPLVFTYHTMYEHYAHFGGFWHDAEGVILDAVGGALTVKVVSYTKHVQTIVAPSTDVVKTLRRRDVFTPIEVIPTGIPLERFACGDGRAFRRRWGYGTDDFVVGTVSRLSQEKNLPFLAQAITRARSVWPPAPPFRFLVVGEGPLQQQLREQGADCVGTLQGQDLVDAYHAMDVFAFASLVETQGMVIAEALAAGVPVAAVDAPGVRDVVVDRVNGRLSTFSVEKLAEAILEARNYRAATRSSVQHLSVENWAARIERLYQAAIAIHRVRRQ